MSTQIQYLRGSAAQLNSFTGVAAEIVVDTTDWTLRVLDGATTGGYALVGLTQTQTLTNKTLITPTITGAVPTLSVTGNVQAGNISTAGLVSATGNVTGNFFIGNGSALTGVVATSIGTLASLSVTGTATAGQFIGAGNTLSNIQGANVSGAVATATSATTAGTVTTAAQGNITSVGTLTSLNSGAISSSGNVTTAGQFIGAGTGLTGTAASLTAGAATTATSATTAGTVTTAAQGNITSVGTLTSLAVSGNTTASNFIGTLNGSGANVTSISATNISSGTLDQARLANTAVTLGSTALTLGATVTTVAGLTSVTSTTFVGALTGAATSATTAGTVTTAAQGNITSVGTLSSLSVSGAITIAGGIVNGGANSTGNIGSSSTYFNTVFAKATSAQYADLAEMYCADIKYPPGTVVEFGGELEVTQTTATHSTAVAGIVSTHPSYLMNSTLDCSTAIEVALVGRVPCFVVGTIRKGDRLVSSNLPGVATALKAADYQPGCIVGKALEAYNSDEVGTIEVAVGRV